mmetsp:Transcript_123188/g.282432  ORF Transcript_123188/g.282432 Transcript_123188/m.282432 type:complete len:286 (-) Transcript_123188:983-1840(-)
MLPTTGHKFTEASTLENTVPERLAFVLSRDAALHADNTPLQMVHPLLHLDGLVLLFRTVASEIHEVLVADEGLAPHLIQVLIELGLAGLQVFYLAELVSHREHVQQGASGSGRCTLRVYARLPKIRTWPQFTRAVAPLHPRQPATRLIDRPRRPGGRPRPTGRPPPGRISRPAAARRPPPAPDPPPPRRLTAHPDLQRGPWPRRQVVPRDRAHAGPGGRRRAPRLAGLGAARGETVLRGWHHGAGGVAREGGGGDRRPGPGQAVLRSSAVGCQPAQGFDHIASHC